MILQVRAQPLSWAYQESSRWRERSSSYSKEPGEADPEAGLNVSAVALEDDRGCMEQVQS